MIVKCLGILTLLSITLYFCYELTMLEKRRLRQTEGFLLLLRHIRAEISCFCSPLCEIFDAFQNESLEECGFLSALKSSNLSEAIEKTRSRIYLEQEEINMLGALASQLGSSYRDQQIELCDYYIGEFENLFTKTREEHPKRSKLCRGVVLTGGLMLIIVLI